VFYQSVQLFQPIDVERLIICQFVYPHANSFLSGQPTGERLIKSNRHALGPQRCDVLDEPFKHAQIGSVSFFSQRCRAIYQRDEVRSCGGKVLHLGYALPLYRPATALWTPDAHQGGPETCVL
jgi:hypothetical protein